MARSYTQQHRQTELNQLGKGLTRRAKASCELCGTGHTALSIFEVPPLPDSPDLEHCVYLCHTCYQQFEDPRFLDSSHWRCLHGSAWSETPAVQVMAVLQLNKLGGRQWADDLREHLYLQPEVEDWVARAY